MTAGVSEIGCQKHSEGTGGKADMVSEVSTSGWTRLKDDL